MENVYLDPLIFEEREKILAVHWPFIFQQFKFVSKLNEFVLIVTQSHDTSNSLIIVFELDTFSDWLNTVEFDSSLSFSPEGWTLIPRARGWGSGVGGGGTPVKLGWMCDAKVLTLFKDTKSKIDTLLRPNPIKRHPIQGKNVH